MSSNNISSPLITIIIAVYNNADTIQQSIDSVVEQSYPNKELIIIDGNSNDGTVDILLSNEENISYWISEPDTGVYNAWNKGLRKANGDWICFLGADDFFWDNQILKKLTLELTKLPNHIKLAYAKIMLIGKNDKALFPAGEPWETAGLKFRQGICLPHQGVIHKKSLFDKHGIFDESFRVGGDYELMLRELKSEKAVFIPDIIVAGMRYGGLSSQPSGSVQAMLDIRRAQKMHGKSWPSSIWILAFIKVYFRLFLWKIVGENNAKKMLDLARQFKGKPRFWTKI